MATIYKAPDWLYKPANIDLTKLKAIQSEVLQVANLLITDPVNGTSEILNAEDIETIKKKCPVLTSELTRLGISDLLFMFMLITVKPGSYFPIHVDYPDPARLSFGLNIPILNCKNSYTIWYDAEVLPHQYLPSYLTKSPLVATAYPCNEETAVEIGRVECSTPSWINNHIPHQPYCEHNKFRINLSLRFHTPIYEMLDNGYFEQHLVKHD